VHRFASNIAIDGDMGWVGCKVRRDLEMLRFWNRLLNMNANCLTKKVFIWDYSQQRSISNWNSDIYKLFEKIGKMYNYVNLIPINLNEAKQILVNCEKQSWSDNLLDYPKLRFYRNFKYCKETEAFVYCVHNRSQRSILAQLRCGILPLKVETGRFNQIPLEFRLCTLCDQNSVEDECHFLFDCTLYDEIRTKYFRYILQLHPYYFEMSKEQKLNLLMSKELVKYTAEFIYNCYIKRRSIIYSS
jgi:hypothetical protein